MKSHSKMIIASVVCLMCCIPQQAICEVVSIEKLAKKLAAAENPPIYPTACIGFSPPNPFETSFNNLIDTIEASKDPLETTRQFMSLFIHEINDQLSLEDGCRMLRQNMAIVPKEYHDIFLLGIDSIEKTNSPSYIEMQAACTKFIGTVTPSAALIKWLIANKEEANRKIRSKDAAIKGLIFVCIATAITLVSIYKPEATPAAGTALLEITKLFLAK